MICSFDVLPVQLDDEAQVAVDAERRRFAEVSIEHLRAVREEQPVLGTLPREVDLHDSPVAVTTNEPFAVLVLLPVLGPNDLARRRSAVWDRPEDLGSPPTPLVGLFVAFVPLRKGSGNASQAIAFCGTAPLAWGRRNRPPSSAAIAALSSSDRPSQASQPSAKAFFKAGRRSKSSTKPGGCSIVMSACPGRPPPTTRAGARDPRHPRRGSWSGRRGALGDSNHGEKRGLLLDSRPKAFH